MRADAKRGVGVYKVTYLLFQLSGHIRYYTDLGIQLVIVVFQGRLEPSQGFSYVLEHRSNRLLHRSPLNCLKSPTPTLCDFFGVGVSVLV